MNDTQALRPVSIVDVSPRDGLQNEKIPVSTEDKLRLIRELLSLGARRIEAVSFVNPRKVPQMADADAVMAGVPRDAGASFIGLVLNTRGAVRAVDAGVDEMNYVLPVTDAFAAANQNTTVAAALAALEEVSSIAEAASIPLTVTAAVAFGCPYQGDVPKEQTLAVVRSALQRGAVAEVALADTIGCAVPWQECSCSSPRPLPPPTSAIPSSCPPLQPSSWAVRRSPAGRAAQPGVSSAP